MIRLFLRVLFLTFLSMPAAAGSGWLDWLPERDKLKYCDTSVTDILGAASLTVTALAASGATITTTTMAPSLFLIAGESSLMFAYGATISVVSTPIVGTSGAVIASASSVAYGGGKTLCALSEFLEPKYITNEDIPLVEIYKDYRWGVDDKSGFASGEYKFVARNEVIPAGTAVFSLGPISEDAAEYYPDYKGRGLIQLGRFYDHTFSTDRPENDRNFVVVPANSLNPIIIDKYTHVFLEDTLVEKNGQKVMLPSGFPFELLKIKKNDRAIIELSDSFNLSVENFSKLKVGKISDLIANKK